VSAFETELRPHADEISAFSENISNLMTEAGVDVRAAHHVAMILEELLTNLGTHGGVPDDPAKVRISIEPERVVAEVEDKGPEFDPRAMPDPDIHAPLEERRIGGLGLFLARKLTESLDYARRGETNHTRFAVKRA
jgi:serine/threonine-protein kinase RsbW